MCDPITPANNGHKSNGGCWRARGLIDEDLNHPLSTGWQTAGGEWRRYIFGSWERERHVGKSRWNVSVVLTNIHDDGWDVHRRKWQKSRRFLSTENGTSMMVMMCRHNGGHTSAVWVEWENVAAEARSEIFSPGFFPSIEHRMWLEYECVVSNSCHFLKYSSLNFNVIKWLFFTCEKQTKGRSGLPYLFLSPFLLGIMSKPAKSNRILRGSFVIQQASSHRLGNSAVEKYENGKTV